MPGSAGISRAARSGASAGHPAGEDAARADIDLARALGRGDAAAMRRALDEFLPPVYAVAHRMLGNPADADEVAQETFLRVWRHAGRWTPKGARLSTWVTRIAVNLCYDRLRKSGRARDMPLEDAPEIADAAPGADAGVMQLERAQAAHAALDALPDRQRLAIHLVHIEEMSNIDAAAAMDISVEALESLLARGRRGLKARLAGRRADLLGDER